MDLSDGNFDPEYPTRPPAKRRWLRKLLTWFAVGLVVVIGGAAYAYHCSQQEPDFYRAALRQTPEAAREKGAELETTLMEIYNSVLEQGPWRGEVTQDQINGWLTTELPEKFPELLPNEVVSDPRVCVDQGEISLAGRLEYQNMKAIGVAKLDVFKTDQKDQIAIRFRAIRVGIIPVPIQSFADEITRGLENEGYQPQWSELDGDPLLTVIVPEKGLLIQGLYRVKVETVDLEEEKIIVSGTTINQVEEEANRVGKSN
jgi:hypothetical protein